MKILVIGSYCWGKADTEEEAKLKARQAGGREGMRRYAVYEVSDETWVDDTGNLCRNHDSPWSGRSVRPRPSRDLLELQGLKPYCGNAGLGKVES